MRAFGLALLLLLVACANAAPSTGGELPGIDGAGIRALIDEAEQPLVINVWASWCVPCRSEAPLLRAAHQEFGDEVRFVGIDTQDSQTDGRAFIDEFELGDFEHYFDPTGTVRAELGGFGVPVTYFVTTSGEVTLHAGIIDERALALGIDELRQP